MQRSAERLRFPKSYTCTATNLSARIPLQSKIGSEVPIFDSFPPGEAFAALPLSPQRGDKFHCKLPDKLKFAGVCCECDRPLPVRNVRKIVLDKRTKMWFNTSNIQTVEAEVTLQAHPQRVPGAESGAKSGAANGPPRAGGKGRPEYPLTRCLR